MRRILPVLLIAASLDVSDGTNVIAAETSITAEARYVMADGDTLAIAEERVLQRAQRRAIEEAGIYLESTFLDYEKASKGERIQTSSLQIRTLAAAITRTEILESRRSFENDRPAFFVRIRALVNLEYLQDAIRRWQSDRQSAEHFRQLQTENARLKTQLQKLQARPAGVRMLAIQPVRQNGTRQRARALVSNAVGSHDLRQKLDLASEAAALDPQSADPLIVRGQTYLQLVSAAYSNRSKASDYSVYIDEARMDFDRALLIDSKSTWALLGKGDVNRWLERPKQAVAAYQQALVLNPFFDVARHRLIMLHTTEARKLMASKQWSAALNLINSVLQQPVAESWIPYQKEAILVRAELYRKLNQPAEAIDDLGLVLGVDPSNNTALLARARLYHDRLQGQLAKDDFEHACLLGSSEACEQLP